MRTRCLINKILIISEVLILGRDTIKIIIENVLQYAKGSRKLGYNITIFNFENDEIVSKG